MKSRIVIAALLCAVLFTSAYPLQAAHLSPFHQGPQGEPVASQQGALQHDLNDALGRPAAEAAPSWGATSEEHVPLGAIPAKSGVPGLDSGLSKLSTLSAQGELRTLASIEEAGKAQGLTVKDGRVRVAIAVEDGALDTIRSLAASLGGTIEASYESTLQSVVPPSALALLSDAPGVRFIYSPPAPITLGPPQAGQVSEGVQWMGLEPWQRAGMQGQGIKIAITDTGFDAYWNLLGTELPRDVIIKSFRADGDITGNGDAHGTAVAEIVYDVAPEAIFYLVNFSTEVELGNAVDYLIQQNVHVISSSVGWPGTAYGDGRGSVSDIVQKAEAAGIVWVQAAGNFGNTHWTGYFNDPDGNGFHSYTATDEGNTIFLRRLTPNDERVFRVDVFLTWDDWTTFSEDFDLFLFRGESVVAQSTAFQNGKFPPVEHIVYTTAAQGDYWIAIQRFRATRRVKLDILVTVDYNLEHKVPGESIVIPGDAPAALTVGAVEDGTLNPRIYSSQGPTKAGVIKPDMVAPDQVTTFTYGPQGFTGTSASAPYVAGAAALLKQAKPSLKPAEIRAALAMNAQGPGFSQRNNAVGAGRVFMGDVPGRVFFPMVPKQAQLIAEP